MKNEDNFQYEVFYENDQNTQDFFNRIKKEYIRGLIKVYAWLLILVVLYITHQFFINLYDQNYLKIIFIQINTSSIFIIYLIFQLLSLTYSKFSPSLVNFLKNELSFLGFNFYKKLKIGFAHILFLIVSIISLGIINLLFFIFQNDFINSMIIRLIIIFMLLGVSVPILRGQLNEKFISKLKSPYFIEIEIQIILIMIQCSMWCIRSAMIDLPTIIISPTATN